MSAPESFDDHVSRVQQMAHDANAETWDLSPNDRAALLALLQSHRALLALLHQAKAPGFSGWCGGPAHTPHCLAIQAALSSADGTA
jgi:hypothetical protein